MKRLNSLILTAGCLAAFGLGCAGVETTVRAQSPYPQEPYYHASRNTPLHAAGDLAQDIYQVHHNTSTTYYNGVNAMCPPGQAYPGAYSGAYCPPGGGYGGHDFGIHHGFSYSYTRPNDLSYPNSNFGGLVVYPYYTHKGPSDFFRK